MATKATHDFFTVCRTPALASTITLQPIERYPLLDTAIIFSDILVIPQALGLTVEMLEKRGPVFPDPIRQPEDLARIDLTTPAADLITTQLSYVFDAIKETKKKLAALGATRDSGEVPLFGFVGAPWTLMAYMIEGGGSKLFTECKRWVFKHPEASHQLLQRTTDLVIEFLAQQVLAGADIVQVFDSWAGELAPHDFEVFSLQYMRQISARLPERLKELGVTRRVPMVVFAKGAWFALDKVCDAGFDVVGLDWTWSPEEAAKIARGRVTLQGNLDPGVLYGGREAITREVGRMLESVVRGREVEGGLKGWVVNLGHGITPGVKPEDMGFFLEEVDRIGKELWK